MKNKATKNSGKLVNNKVKLRKTVKVYKKEKIVGKC